MCLRESVVNTYADVWEEHDAFTFEVKESKTVLRPEEEGSVFLRNARNCLLADTLYHPGRLESAVPNLFMCRLKASYRPH
jgi:hypothetical protein